MMKLLVLKNLKGLVLALLLCQVGQANANIFNVETSFPDIVNISLNFEYTASSGDFHIVSNALITIGNYAESAANDANPFTGAFLLDFSVDGSGALENADALGNFGSFSIMDTALLPFLPPLNGVGASTLLSGYVTDFAFDSNSFDVLLNITSGFLAPVFGFDAIAIIGGGGATGFSLGSDFVALAPFNANTKKVVQQVPEPSILILFTIAGLSVFRAGRQQQG